MEADNQQRDDHEGQTATCPVCGATVEPEDRFCRNCGAAVGTGEARVFSGPEPDVPADAPTERLETFAVSDPHATEPVGGPLAQGPVPPPPDVEVTGEQISRAREGGRSQSSRTWLIVLLIIALVLIVCCCLMLALLAVAAADSSFQDELNTIAVRWLQL